MSSTGGSVATAADAGPRGLSCYSANLACYLARSDPGALDAIARSVHLAVRTGLPGDALAVSHHGVPLHELPAGGVLCHTAARSAEVAAREIVQELRRNGQVVVVTSSAALPWSVARPEESTPHLVLVDGWRGGRWHAVDEFSALLPRGRQEPFVGWIGEDQLLAAMAPQPRPRQEHRLRDEHMFGVPVPLPPADTYRWLALRPGAVRGARLPDGWVTGAAAALAALAEFWCGLAEHPQRCRFLDDMWACSQHHTFRYARLLHTEHPSVADASAFVTAAAAWRDLPMALHFAAQSAVRGRARPAVVRASFDHLGAAEAAAQRLLPRYGYPSAP